MMYSTRYKAVPMTSGSSYRPSIFGTGTSVVLSACMMSYSRSMACAEGSSLHVALFSPNDIRMPLEAIGVRVLASGTPELLAA